MTTWSVFYIIIIDHVVCYLQRGGIFIKREEKNIISKDKIFQAAIDEFGSKGYANASINNICNDNNISKGLIYHYYKSKDELFLLCVGECFDKLSSHLDRIITFCHNEIEKNIEDYFIARYEFFDSYKEFRQIFCDAVLQTPKHLTKEIADLKEGFYSVNRRFLKKILKQLNLRDSISEDEAMEYFIIFQEFFNSYFQRNQSGDNFVSDIIKLHEIQCHKILDIILYGIAKQGEKK